jgi:hypothetical protein
LTKYLSHETHFLSSETVNIDLNQVIFYAINPGSELAEMNAREKLVQRIKLVSRYQASHGSSIKIFDRLFWNSWNYNFNILNVFTEMFAITVLCAY